MNCQQKSGVFLNDLCQNEKQKTCTHCKKEVCEVHSHKSDSSIFCEDCYWEHFLLTPKNEASNFISDSSDVILAGSALSSMSNTTSSDEPSGFQDGFGGGEFGGGGASGAWTEGDIQSLEDTNAQGGLLSDRDDTFFYS